MPGRNAWGTPSDAGLWFEHMFDITPSDTEDLPYATRVIYASADCVLNVTLTGGETQQLTVFRGYNPLPVVKVWATDTVVGTASVKGCY